MPSASPSTSAATSTWSRTDAGDLARLRDGVELRSISPESFDGSKGGGGHALDPIHFATDVRVDIQALGWKTGHRYQPLTDDVASTAYFYLDRPERPPRVADRRRSGGRRLPDRPLT
jgi:Protein of unknown function (DUF2961)